MYLMKLNKQKSMPIRKIQIGELSFGWSIAIIVKNIDFSNVLITVDVMVNWSITINSSWDRMDCPSKWKIRILTKGTGTGCVFKCEIGIFNFPSKGNNLAETYTSEDLIVCLIFLISRRTDTYLPFCLWEERNLYPVVGKCPLLWKD